MSRKIRNHYYYYVVNIEGEHFIFPNILLSDKKNALKIPQQIKLASKSIQLKIVFQLQFTIR